MTKIARFLSIAALSAATLTTAPAGATDFTVVGQSESAGVHFAKIEMVDSSGSIETRVIKFSCDQGVVSSASIDMPRDSTSGVASGKRMHKPFTMTKEFDAVSLAVPRGSWDLATGKGARSISNKGALDDWTAITVSGLDPVCSAASTK